MFSGLNKFKNYIYLKDFFMSINNRRCANHNSSIDYNNCFMIVFGSKLIKTQLNCSSTKTIEEVYKNDKKKFRFFTDSYKNNFNFEIGINQEVFKHQRGADSVRWIDL